MPMPDYEHTRPLQFGGVTDQYNDRAGGVAELSGTLRKDSLRAYFLAHGDYLDDVRGSGGEAKFYEAYLAWQASSSAAFEAGKKTQRWGKGYAWSPVAFLERPKDPEDPELARDLWERSVEWTGVDASRGPA